jgi:hypothetical protein
MSKLNIALIVTIASGLACDDVPSGVHFAPKLIKADGILYTACTDQIYTYHPSRDIAASTQPSYEVTFTDDYGREQDLKDLNAYTIIKPDEKGPLTFAMAASATPDNKMIAYSNGTPFKPGDVVLFGNNGDAGRAIWKGAGQWSAVPCK